MKLNRSHWRNNWNTPAVISRHVPRLYILVSVICVTWDGGWKGTHNDATALYYARLDGDPTIHPIGNKRKKEKEDTHVQNSRRSSRRAQQEKERAKPL